MRNVDEWVVEWLIATQAKLDGHSLESELRQILTEAALAKKREIADEMRAGLAELSRSKRCSSPMLPKSSARTGIVAGDRRRRQCRRQVVLARSWLGCRPGAHGWPKPAICSRSHPAGSPLAITRRVCTAEATAEISMTRCNDWLRHLRAEAVSVLPEHDLLEDAVGWPRKSAIPCRIATIWRRRESWTLR